MCCWYLFSGVGMVAVFCRDVASEGFIARGDSEKCTSQSFACEYTYVLILLMVSIRGFEKVFPFFNVIQG